MAVMYRVRAASTGWAGAPGLNTFYFLRSADPAQATESDATLCANRVRDAFTATNTLWPTQWTVQVSSEVEVLAISTGNLIDSFSVPPIAAISGVSQAGFGPLPACMLVRLKTNTFSDGSRLQGRAFLGPIIPISEANGTPNAGGVAAVAGFGAALLDVGVNGGPSVCVWRRPREAKPVSVLHPNGVTARAGMAAAVTSTSAPDKFAVLRSRRD